jgi:DNA-binding NtrC family response regulator
MVYGIVKNHHGHIEYESEPGEGTKFSIYFPVSTSDDVLQEEISAKEVKKTTGNEIILLIEDNESILDAVEKMLQHFGYIVVTASYGEQAIEIYRSRKDTIDLVILTLNMPGVGGRKCLERLIELKPDLKAIVTSGYTSDANLNIVQNGGNTVFVEKPYQLEELLRIVRDILDRDT